MHAQADASLDNDRVAELEAAVAEAARWLPHQGPIGVFVHHNTLVELEDRPFHDAILEAHARLGAEPYWSEVEYRRAHQNGRIDPEDLRYALDRVLDRRRSRKRRLCGGRLSLEELRELALHHDLDPLEAPAAEFLLRSGTFSSAIVRAALLRASEPLGVPLTSASRRPLERPRDVCVRLGWSDPDSRVHEVLIPACAAFCDRGVANRAWPERELGFYASIRRLWQGHPPGDFGRELVAEFAAQESEGLDARAATLRSLDALEIPPKEWGTFIAATFLALPGWFGIMRWIEHESGEVPIGEPVLIQLLAVRLTLDLLSLSRTLAECGESSDSPARLFELAMREREQVPTRVSGAARALQLARLADLCGWDAPVIEGLANSDLRALFQALDHFDGLVRRRVWHEAYERHYRREILLAIRAKSRMPDDTPRTPRAQVVVCIDEREESFRRHIEEVCPEIETVGTAGFFGVAIDYRGLDDHGYAPLCPVVVAPEHAIEERAHEEDVHLVPKRVLMRGLWFRGLHRGRVAAHSYGHSFWVTALLGWVAALPLVFSVLAPRFAARMARAASRALSPKPRTRLERTYSGAQNAHGKPLGFRLEEQIERVAGLLRGAGMAERLSQVVLVLGHGSTSLNNPHESAHDCGACGGRQGGANARIIADMANDPAVRAGVRAKGISIPDSVWFVGGLHDTCSDNVVLYDLDLVPSSHRSEVEALAGILDEARARNAHERCRRFDFAPRSPSYASALRHVERRATALDEPRPEYGHATNAICVVGRRRLTRRLFLDRRAFLTSYDPVGDVDGAILAATLGAVVPVCAGINLEYYFSFVDNERYGCGTKLPHNLTGWLGVMNGSKSDLRTGLPWQMVEIHEPVRLLFVIEATPARISEIAHANPAIARMFFNGWVQVASVHPETGRIAELRGDVWQALSDAPIRLLQARSSPEWYQGRRDALGPAYVGPLGGK